MAEGSGEGSAEASRSLRLTVIGSAAAWALRAARPSSCYLVELDDDAIVLDLGQGAFGALAQRRAPERVLAYVISHLHPDHHADLVALRHYLKFGGVGDAHVQLHAPGDLRRRYDTFTGEEGFLTSLPGEDVAEGTWTDGPFSVQARPVTHALNAHGFRVRAAGEAAGPAAAPALVYSGDCGRWQDLVPLIRPGDTLLCEAFWGESAAEAEEMHLPAADAARAASAGRAGRLVLTHINERADRDACAREAARHFDGPVLIAEPGLTLRIE